MSFLSFFESSFYRFYPACIFFLVTGHTCCATEKPLIICEFEYMRIIQNRPMTEFAVQFNFHSFFDIRVRLDYYVYVVVPSHFPVVCWTMLKSRIGADFMNPTLTSLVNLALTVGVVIPVSRELSLNDLRPSSSSDFRIEISNVHCNRTEDR